MGMCRDYIRAKKLYQKHGVIDKAIPWEEISINGVCVKGVWNNCEYGVVCGEIVSVVRFYIIKWSLFS